MQHGTTALEDSVVVFFTKLSIVMPRDLAVMLVGVYR